MLLEKTQRRLCRALFVAGCVLPTLAVAGFTTNRLRPTYAESLLLAAGESLGVTLECDEIITPRPHIYEAVGLRVTDSMTGSELLKCEEARFHELAGGWRLAAREVTVSPTAANSMWLRRLLDSSLEVEGDLANVQLDQAETLATVSLRLTVDATGTRRFRLLGPGETSLQATRLEHSLEIAADTADHTVPASWLGEWPLSFACNESARFAGSTSTSWHDDSRTSTGSAIGRFETSQLDFAGLAAQRGTLAIESMSWSGGRIQALEGRLNLREGRLARSIVWGACMHLGTKPFDTLNTLWDDPDVGEDVPFTQLACEVELGPQGVVLVAGCDSIDGQMRGGAVAHSILTLDGEPLLQEPATRPLPMQRLVRAWFPDQQAELPATAAAVDMMRALPAGR